VAKRNPPINLQQDDLSLFNHEFERKIPRTNLLEMRDVCASPEGLLFKRARISSESYAFPSMLEEWRAHTLLKFLTLNYLLRKHVVFQRDAAWVVDNWSPGYFHWLADVLPRLFTIKDRTTGLVLLLPHRYKDVEFVHSSLKPFNLAGIEFIGKDEVTICRRLIVPSHTAPSGHYNEEIINGVRNLLVDYYGDQESRVEGRVYISRARAAKRRIVNEEEILKVLREFGFRILYAEDMTFAEQVRTFSSARHVVSNHGAGLTNMLFMPPGGNVLELRHHTDSVNNCYFTLASAISLNYFYQTCEPENPGEDPHLAHLVVDLARLKVTLEEMLRL
jgi:capsular polysaccharide biosynthesis protein